MAKWSDKHPRLTTEELILKFQPLLWHLVEKYLRRYVGSGGDKDDLIGTAQLGLVRAAQTYNPRRGKFVGWAQLHIRAEMLRMFEKQNKWKTKFRCWPKPHKSHKSLLAPNGQSGRVRARVDAVRILDLLPPLDADIVRMRLGIGTFDPMPWKKIANQLGISQRWTIIRYNAAIEQCKFDCDL